MRLLVKWTNPFLNQSIGPCQIALLSFTKMNSRLLLSLVAFLVVTSARPVTDFHKDELSLLPSASASASRVNSYPLADFDEDDEELADDLRGKRKIASDSDVDYSGFQASAMPTDNQDDTSLLDDLGSMNTRAKSDSNSKYSVKYANDFDVPSPEYSDLEGWNTVKSDIGAFKDEDGTRIPPPKRDDLFDDLGAIQHKPSRKQTGLSGYQKQQQMTRLKNECQKMRRDLPRNPTMAQAQSVLSKCFSLL